MSSCQDGTKNCTLAKENVETTKATIEKEINPDGKKRSWPELKGENVETAKATILKERPDLYVVVLPEGAPWTNDEGFSRVRLVVNEKGQVVNVPSIG
ncbi:Proteinase inhibitor I13, potato inhibitor I [Corchorus capsularis]|uniref:Proteinase inhibitor I13, potato inhibitor I n=1 Tax=Corchorus capsularis TaxID=210143 RepID=A0A1R3JSK8_COCAP|nr:Proteinase inhibitor I13, potato inhibitor I [Corchorus capsularis]